jgi:hypothetical protein
VPVNLVFRLADAPGDADKIADCGIGEPVAHLVKQGDAVPLRIGLPCFAFAAVVVGGDRDVGDVLGGVDLGYFDGYSRPTSCRGRPMPSDAPVLDLEVVDHRKCLIGADERGINRQRMGRNHQIERGDGDAPLAP